MSNHSHHDTASTQTDHPDASSSSATESTDPSTHESQDGDYSMEDLIARNELLREENRRLRTAHVTARQTAYHRAAIGVGAFGVLAGLGGIVFPATRATLFALAGIGLFTAVLTYYITPERFVAATVGDRIYRALATHGAELSSALGLQDTHLYIPIDEPSDVGAQTTPDQLGVRLFIPQHTDYTKPAPADLSEPFVVPENDRARGVSFPPTGGLLFREFEQTMTDALESTPEALTEQLTEAVVQGFELADNAVPTVMTDDHRITVELRGSTIGNGTRFDHPIGSFIATGLAIGLETPIQLETTTAETDRADQILVFTWGTEADEDATE